MNWIYIDRETFAVKFGNRLDAEPHITGPFDCTRQDKRLTFDGWEGFYAVKTRDFWSLYFDVEGDRLSCLNEKFGEVEAILEVNLLRSEVRVKPAKTDLDGTKEDVDKAETQGTQTQTSTGVDREEFHVPEVD
jgi:hypothetical protein